MSEPSKPTPPVRNDIGRDPLRTVEQFKRAPVRIGCLGCMLTGLIQISAGIIFLLALAYFIRRFLH